MLSGADVRLLVVQFGPRSGIHDNQTTTKDGSGCRKKQPAATRGIRTIDRPGRPHPFGVQWREFDQDKNKVTRKTEFFEKEAECDKKARDLAAMKREGWR